MERKRNDKAKEGRMIRVNDFFRYTITLQEHVSMSCESDTELASLLASVLQDGQSCKVTKNSPAEWADAKKVAEQVQNEIRRKEKSQ
jgi:hypothetical protein